MVSHTFVILLITLAYELALVELSNVRSNVSSLVSRSLYQSRPGSTHQDPLILGTSPDSQRAAHYELQMRGSPLELIGRAYEGENDNSPAGKRRRQQEIHYFLRHRSGTYIHLERDGSDTNIWGRWNDNSPVKVIIHGFSPSTWLDRHENIAVQNIFLISEAYASTNPNYNVIVVDWNSLAIEPFTNYPEAAKSTVYAGEDVAEFLIRLKNKGLFSWDKVHIVGFSLGAHTAGIVGILLQANAGGQLGRITGLDPAGPFFDDGGYYKHPDKALDKADADFVDIIHCNMGDALETRLGTTVQSGHADFYPNGGEFQHPCPQHHDLIGCSHNLCPAYFADTISGEYSACPCDAKKWAKNRRKLCRCTKETAASMGEKCQRSASGKYYLSLKSKLN